ncbi:MAG: Ig-like domain-containing protein [Bifidobacteriaceae bacterium]|nr:Ig-like domain-containing protein [Bifidobacteriaceae bacterium]
MNVARAAHGRLAAAAVAAALALTGALAGGGAALGAPALPFGAADAKPLALGAPQPLGDWMDACADPTTMVPAIAIFRYFTFTVRQASTVTLTLAAASPAPGRGGLGFSVLGQDAQTELTDIEGRPATARLTNGAVQPETVAVSVKVGPGTYYAYSAWGLCGGLGTIALTAVTPTRPPVSDAPVVKSVKLSKAKAVLKKGKKLTLKATVKPKAAADKSVTWKSSKPKVARVSAKGVVKALKKGKATVTAKSANGKKDKVKIVVK